jgi:arginyl-tRNA synthetase
MNLLDTLKTSFTPVLAQVAPEAEKVPDYLGMIKPAQNPDHGDYQANFAMPLSKPLKRKPPEIAGEIVGKLPLGEMLETPQVAGPGFINLRFKNDWLAERVREMAKSERLGIDPAAKPKTFVIDYSSPNVAKPLHVGHLRSTIIGESLCRILRFLGHKVVADNHLGDWGTQFGILLYGYKNHLDEAAFRADPLRELARLYVHVRSLFAKASDDDDEPANDPVADACRQETAKLHAGDPENRRLWEMFMPHCLEEIQAVYRRLDIHFDVQLGESYYQPMLGSVIDDLVKKGVAHESNGALVVANAKGVVPKTAEEMKKEDPPALVRKRDGAFTYTTTDLATVRYRVETYQPNEMLYVVDFRQELHFKTLFAAAKRWGYSDVGMYHLKFGSVLGKDGKPISTRKGGGFELNELLDEAIREGGRTYEQSRQARIDVGQEVPELTEAEICQIAETVGLGAVKYADLSQNRTSDYKFDYDKMLATDGNTATYMQYAYVRCRGIFRKEAIDDSPFRTDPPKVLIARPEERALVLQLLRFSEALDMAATEYMPNHLTSYIYDLATTYSGFFVNCPVLKAETEELKLSRLLLCDLTARVIQKTLELLGIKTVERM